MDTHAFASLAHVRILLLPVGSIQQSIFEKYAAEIRSFYEIRLGDIPSDNKDERARFMPNPLSTGHLHLSFPSHPPPLSHVPLSLLRPSHFPLAVVGVAACSQTDSLRSILTQFNTSLVEVFPPGCMYPLAKNCFVFEDGNGTTNLNLGNNLPGLVVIPSMMGNKKLYIGTLLADLCSHILGELGVVVQALESPLGNEYLNSTLMPTLPSLSDIPKPLDANTKLDSLPPTPSYNNQPDLSKSGFTLGAVPSLKRASATGPSLLQSTLGVSVAKKRSSGIGVASSHGRLFKVLGDFFLLAGRPEDASVWYTEAILLFKTSQDAVWHAGALEGMATVSLLDAWSAGNGLHTSTAAATEPWADIYDKLTQATALYYKSPTNDGEQNYSLLAYLYTCCVLRQSSLLFAVWSAKGWGPLAFTTMLQPGPTPYLPPTLSRDEHNSWLNVERLSSISGISRSTISSVLAQVHGPWLLHLGARERIAVLEVMAGIYACLGYRRKEAYILREILGCILDLLVCGREEDGFSRTSAIPGTAGLGIQGLNSSTALPSWRGSVGIRLSESAEGNESILILLKYVCKVLGINLDAVRLVDVDTDSPATDAFAKEYDDDSAHSPQEPCGWPELQVGVVREAVAVAESLPDYLAVAQFALSSLKTLQSVLAPGDQHHLYSTSTRALMTAQRRGDTKSVEYWSGRPIVSIIISPLPLVRLPIENPISALATRSSEISPVLPGSTDPFLYNPRRVLAGQGNTLVVQQEMLQFVVILQNPFIFDLELQSLALSTSGVPFESQAIHVVVPSASFHRVTLTGKAIETGALVIRGCVVKAPGGVSREFILPLSTDEEEERHCRRRSTLACETGRTKYSGLDALPWEKASRRTSAQLTVPPTSAPIRFMECKVVPEQPLLRIRRTSVTHGAVMLYDGEMSTIRITLENVSSLPVDFLRLVFDDSTIAPAQQALTEGDLSVFDTYETEYDLIHRPMFSWNRKEARDIAPGQNLTLTVACRGKVGCTTAAVHISYSYVHRPQSSLQAASEVFHTRQLLYPVMVTVYQMIECQGMDVLAFPSYASEPDDGVDTQTWARRSNLYVGDEASWCLFSIEVRNTYGLPFEVIFERVQEDTPRAIMSATVPPGSTSRIVIPLKKFLLSEDQVSSAIPTLSQRQFVVTKSKLSDVEEKIQRELFWYREQLFKCICGRWREAGGTRTGDLSLRQQRMTLHMLETLRTEAARVYMSLTRYDSDDSGTAERPIVEKGGKYYPCANEFVYLRTKVTNMSPSSLVFTVNLGIEPSEHLVYEGVLSDLPIGRLESGESRDVETALCFLSYGRFEITAEIRILGGFRIGSGTSIGKLIAIVQEDV